MLLKQVSIRKTIAVIYCYRIISNYHFMKISRKFHGILDYLSAIVLILSPWLFNFSQHQTAKLIMILAGAAVIIIFTLTNYEAGLIKKIPMAVHLNCDVLLGIILLISPWLFKFADQVFLPHLLIGLFSIAAGLLTERSSYRAGNNINYR
jgi:hypothetical protein